MLASVPPTASPVHRHSDRTTDQARTLSICACPGDPLEASLSTLPAFTALPSGAPPPIGLVPLPRSFEQLFHEAAAAPCAQCGASPETRALCLACGAVVCGIESPHGPRAAVSHAHACSTGAGLFVLTSSSAVLLVRERRVMLLGRCAVEEVFCGGLVAHAAWRALVADLCSSHAQLFTRRASNSTAIPHSSVACGKHSS
eukprot:6171896-Pleurochrysis_carterae.AAC.2